MTTVVIGNGWAALGAVGFLLKTGHEISSNKIYWLPGQGTRVLPPLCTVEYGKGSQSWEELASAVGVAIGHCEEGQYLREFRNKSFREPSWLKQQALAEELWAPEKRLIAVPEGRFPATLGEIEDQIRMQTTTQDKLVRKESVPVVGFHVEDDLAKAVILGSGERIACDKVIYADAWRLLPGMEGMPKPISFMRKREPVGALQAMFIHKSPVMEGCRENFFASLHREAGETVERHVWGYFGTDGLRSTWTLCLAPEELEDNHMIAKKLRRLKSTLDKVFESSGLIPSEKGKFADTVLDEQVRFEEEFIFTAGQPMEEPAQMQQIKNIHFLTDGYGPGYAMIQAQKVSQ